MSDIYHHGVPDSFRYKENFTLDDQKLSLYLDTNSNDKILGLYFTWPGSEEIAMQFSSFCKQVEGLNFGQYPKREFPGLHAPSLFYRNLIDIVKRGSPLFPYARGRSPLKLVCRCFGVYEEDIHELFGQGLEIKSIKDVGDHTQAGFGCGSCHKDLGAIIDPLISAPVLIPDEPSTELPLWQKLDTDSFARLAFQEIKNLNEEALFKASLLGTRPGGILVKIESSELEVSKAQDLIKERIEAALGKGLEISFQ